MLPFSEFLYSFSETTRGGKKVKKKTCFGVYSTPASFFLIFFSQKEESVKLVINISTQDYTLPGCDTV
jgi:hypothetical protein